MTWFVATQFILEGNNRAHVLLIAKGHCVEKFQQSRHLNVVKKLCLKD